MKSLLKSGVFLLALALIVTSFTTSYSTLGHESSTIVWTGKKVTGEHTGTIGLNSMSWKFDETGSLASADFEVDMMSIKCTDLDEKSAAKLEGHLSSPDFFNTTVHPIATFVTTEVISEGKGKYSITGDMTIKGITESMTISAEVINDGHMNHATAQVSIDRTKYDIKYGSGSFFEGLGDKMINDEFILDIDIKKH